MSAHGFLITWLHLKYSYKHTDYRPRDSVVYCLSPESKNSYAKWTVSTIVGGSCSGSLMENICWGLQLQSDKGSSKARLGQLLCLFCPHVVKCDTNAHKFTACFLALLLDLQYGERRAECPGLRRCKFAGRTRGTLAQAGAPESRLHSEKAVPGTA